MHGLRPRPIHKRNIVTHQVLNICYIFYDDIQSLVWKKTLLLIKCIWNFVEWVKIASFNASEHFFCVQ